MMAALIGLGLIIKTAAQDGQSRTMVAEAEALTGDMGAEARIGPNLLTGTISAPIGRNLAAGVGAQTGKFQSIIRNQTGLTGAQGEVKINVTAVGALSTGIDAMSEAEAHRMVEVGTGVGALLVTDIDIAAGVQILEGGTMIQDDKDPLGRTGTTKGKDSVIEKEETLTGHTDPRMILVEGKENLLIPNYSIVNLPTTPHPLHVECVSALQKKLLLTAMKIIGAIGTGKKKGMNTAALLEERGRKSCPEEVQRKASQCTKLQMQSLLVQMRNLKKIEILILPKSFLRMTALANQCQ
mmetsp:Transcript_152/g.254  ORF Transcript_152/g.254 Transcript_152/m.254 type:complete len:296 (-) Transcript_152:65-952(-)